MLITGKNAVYEALRSDATVEKLYVQRGETTGVVKNIIALAKEKKIVVSVVDKTALRKTQNIRESRLLRRSLFIRLWTTFCLLRNRKTSRPLS